MQKINLKLLGFIALSAVLYSCIDNDYDFDDLNKDGSFNIPPVPIGNVDTFWIETLEPGQVPPGIEIPGNGSVEVKEQLLENLFSTDILDKFFNENAKEDVVLQSKVDVDVLNSASGIVIDVFVSIIDNDGTVNQRVKIPNPEKIYYGNDQDFNIIFPVEYFADMQEARDLKLTLVMTADYLTFTEKDFVFIKDVVLKSGGLHFSF